MSKVKMPLSEAITIAERIKAQLQPHCIKIEIAGSIRRKCPMVGDIEIVAIPKPYQIGLFADGIVPIINSWKKVIGELPCKYTKRILPEGVQLDLFFATPDNWGYILAIRTGSTAYIQKLAAYWKQKGYSGKDGYLWANGRKISTKEESQIFYLLGMPYAEPEVRI